MNIIYPPSRDVLAKTVERSAVADWTKKGKEFYNQADIDRYMAQMDKSDFEFFIAEENGEYLAVIPASYEYGLLGFDLSHTDQSLYKDITKTLAAQGDVFIKIDRGCSPFIDPAFKDPACDLPDGTQADFGEDTQFEVLVTRPDMLAEAFAKRYMTVRDDEKIVVDTFIDDEFNAFYDKLYKPDKTLLWPKVKTINLDNWTMSRTPGFILGVNEIRLGTNARRITHIIAHTDDKIVGVARLKEDYTSVLTMQFIETANFYQGHGVCRKVVEEFCKKSKIFHDVLIKFDSYNFDGPGFKANNDLIEKLYRKIKREQEWTNS